MAMNSSDIPRVRRLVSPPLVALVLIIAEFLVIGLTFKHGIQFDCRLNWGDWACGSASKSLAALYCMAGTGTLFALLRPQLFKDLLAEAGHSARPLVLNLVGFLLAMVPVLFLRDGSGAATIMPAFLAWGFGMALLLGGILGWLAPPALWSQFLRRSGPSLIVALAAGAAAPLLAVQLQPIWQLDAVADATFHAVSWLVQALGYQVISDPQLKMIGTEGFVISVAPVCSGIEGIALVTIFVSLYLYLFRAELRFPRAFLLYPLGIAASAVLNVVRIAALLILGLEGHPDLAVGGFHSHAGWVMFTLIALAIIAVARKIQWLNRVPVGGQTAAPLPPLREDPVAAKILPFAVFMLTATVLPAISANPALFYPIRVLLLAATLALVWPALRGLRWQIDPLAWIVGAAIGLMWIAIPVAPVQGQPPYGALTGAALLLWFVFRGIGTVLLVPLVEELFFRDYLEGRIRGKGSAPLWRSVMAALITAAVFAMLHDRWIEAFIAGLGFSFVAQRKGRIVDAIAAHGLANLIVFSWAVLTKNLAII